MSDDGEETSFDFGGRSIEVDTGYYTVEITGDPDDDFETIFKLVEKAATLAKEDVEQLDDRIDNGDNAQYR